jgi:hypothetical protein
MASDQSKQSLAEHSESETDRVVRLRREARESTLETHQKLAKGEIISIWGEATPFFKE